MNGKIKHSLYRVGHGTANEVDERLLTNYIQELERSEGEITDAYQTATARASSLANEVCLLRKQLAGPDGASFMVFLPGGKTADDLHVADAFRQVSDALLRKVGQEHAKESTT